MATSGENPSIPRTNRELKIHAISLEKEQWDNVSQMVFKSFTIMRNNMESIKGWADRTDRTLRSLDATMQSFEERMGALEKTGEELLTGEASMRLRIDLSDGAGKQQRLASAGALQRLDRCVGALFTLFGETFGVDLNLEPLELPTEGELESADKQSTSSSSSDDEEQPGKDEDKDLDEQHGQGSDQAGVTKRKEVKDVVSKPPAGIKLMQQVGCSLEANLEVLHDAFDNWTELQRNADARTEAMESGIEELRLEADRTRERILTWREMLKESSHAIDSLGQSLATAQSSVQDLYATRVQQHEVDTTVNKKAEELVELHNVTERSVQKLDTRVEDHMAEVQRLVDESRRKTDDRIEEHSSQVSVMVEGHMNPLNAYLNTLHVKTDIMRVDLDQLKDQMPKHSSRIESLSSRLTAAQEENTQKAKDIEGQLETTSQYCNARFEKEEGQHAALTGALQELNAALGERIEGVKGSVYGIADALETMRRDDLSELAKELMSLDQKVAKWVHAHPLPAKISEARLFTLEAKLADEVDARMFFESKVKSRLNVSPRASRVSTVDSRFSTIEHMSADLALPQLLQEPIGDKNGLAATSSGFRSARRRPRDSPGMGSSQSSAWDPAPPMVATNRSS